MNTEERVSKPSIFKKDVTNELFNQYNDGTEGVGKKKRVDMIDVSRLPGNISF